MSFASDFGFASTATCLVVVVNGIPYDCSIEWTAGNEPLQVPHLAAEYLDDNIPVVVTYDYEDDAVLERPEQWELQTPIEACKPTVTPRMDERALAALMPQQPPSAYG